MTRNGKVTELIKDEQEIVLSTGVRARVSIAPAMLIERAASGIKLPQVPKQKLEDGRTVENPLDPTYIESYNEALRNQSQAAIDVMIAFVDLVDPMPEDASEWQKRLKLLQRLGHVDLGEYDLNDPMDAEFVYKKFIAIGSDDMRIISELNGISEEDRARAREAFQRTETRG